MRLLRFACIELNGPVGALSNSRFDHGDVTVSVAPSRISEQAALLVAQAEAPVGETLVADKDGQVIVPEDPRRRAERAIEVAADLISIATGTSRRISSPSLVVSFRAETAEELAHLQSQTRLKDLERAHSFGRFSVSVPPEMFAQLSDRQDGVTLLAEALAQSHESGRFRELMRVFERAFAASSTRLVPVLAAFLDQRPALRFSKTEVRRWIARLRGPATHADRNAILVAADLRPVVDRMLLASYEVLFNKACWHARDSGRRDLWTPTIGPLDADGHWFVLQHSTEPSLLGQIFDAYGAYPLNLMAMTEELDEGCWPRRGPQRTVASTDGFSVLPADDLAVSL